MVEVQSMIPHDLHVSTKNGTFHYLDWGKRSHQKGTVVLLHGFNQTCHSWEDVAPELATDYHVIALDQRGHGESMRAADGDYSRQSMVEDVFLVANQLGLDRLALVGTSMGGAHSIVFAAQHPDMLSCLVLVDVGPDIEMDGALKIAAMCALAWNSFDDAVKAMLQFNPRRTEDNIRRRLKHSLHQSPQGKWVWKVDPALAQHLRFRESSDMMWDTLRQVQCPTLLVRGQQSDILSQPIALKMIDTLPHGTLITVQDAGHIVAGDNPQGFLQAVKPFLEQHQKGSENGE